MSLNLCRQHVSWRISQIFKVMVRTNASKPVQQDERTCVISYKDRKLNHYSNVIYSSLDEVPLISKGWNHSKSKGDSFTIHPISYEYEEKMVNFDLLKIDPKIVETLKKRNIYKATEYQANVFPLLNIDKHLMLAAETGCGKTISYLLPIIENLKSQKTVVLNTPKALVLVPNRELAYQIGESAESIAASVGLKAKVVVGGNTKRLMLNPEFDDIDILIGTPGAIGKLSTVGVYKLGTVMYTVLDEADTLTDDTFVERISSLLRRVPQSKIIMVTATLPRSLPDCLKPIESALHEVISPKLHMTKLNILQKFIRMTRSAKSSNLLQHVKSNKSPMLIFTNRNANCNWLALFLRENGISCSNINGDMHYAIRIEQWNDFVSGKTQILSATDVGSRGLDTTQVRHVINYDFPLYAADYLHRIGRVGRLGGVGSCKAINFISGSEEVRLVQQIEVSVLRFCFY